VATEKQLVVNPAFFTAIKQHLKGIRHVEVLPKRGEFHNEFSMFRYDVILHIGEGTPPTQDVSWLDWRNEKPSPDTIRRLLETEAPTQLGITHIANRRILAERCLLAQLEKSTGSETAADLRQALMQCADPGIDPEDLWLLSETLPYSLEVSWAEARPDGSYDVVFRHQSPETSATVVPFPQPTSVPPDWDEYANKPVQQRLTELLIPQLRKHLKERLPGHMIPAKFMILADLPLTPNGKVDRRALPVPTQTRPDLEKTYVAPRTAIEKTLAEIWAEVLGLERVGIHDNFFDSGGHSLLATQIVSRIKLAIQAEFPLRSVFEFPTIAELAELVVAQQLEQVESDDLDTILAAVDELSDEEAALLLSVDGE
jgi:acyl carrier protein